MQRFKIVFNMGQFTKKIKGSARTEEDGTFIFTPYSSVPDDEKSIHLIKSTRYASLWRGKKSTSVRLVFPTSHIPPYEVWVEEMTQMYNFLCNLEKDDF